MRFRADLIPVGLLTLLAGFIGFQASTVQDGTTSSAGAGVAGEGAAGGATGDSDRELRERARQTLAAGSGGTYIGALLERDSTLVRWPTSAPIRVWVQQSSTIRDWQASQVALTRDAFRAWERELPLTVAWSADSADADVRVTWVSRLAGEEQIGNSSRSYDETGRIVWGEIVLAVHGRGGRPLPERTARIAVLHEVGHILGLEHSPDPRDVMVARYEGQASGLTAADVATARLLYSLPSGRF